MQALTLAGADLVLVPQAGAVGEWPEGLCEAEMRVAAFQNGYYIAFCNRIGREDCLEFRASRSCADPTVPSWPAQGWVPRRSCTPMWTWPRPLHLTPVYCS